MEMIPILVLFVGVFYFLMLRPEQKRKKQAAEMRAALKAGDEITTIGGIIGKVVNVKDDFVTFETGEDRVRIKVTKWAISSTGVATEQQQQRR